MCRNRHAWSLLTHPPRPPPQAGSLGWVICGWGELLQQNKFQEPAVGACDEQAGANSGEMP